jgi:hypothetical protein
LRGRGRAVRYAHVADRALISAAEGVADYIAGALEGRKKGEVVKLTVMDGKTRIKKAV